MLGFVLAAVVAIDPAHSSAQFAVSHIFVERVTGTVPIVGGTIDVPDSSNVPVAVTATLDARGIKTDDEDRNAALRGPEFFDVSRFPTWTFTSTKISRSSDRSFTMAGDLTLHGVTQSELLNVTITGDPSHPHYHATCAIDRHAFGMQKSRLDAAIGNTVDITLDIAVK